MQQIILKFISTSICRTKNFPIKCTDAIRVKVKWSRYRPAVAQRVGRGIDLLFHDRGTRSGWVVSSTPRPHFTPGKVPVPILQEAGWAPGPVWSGGKSRPHRDSFPDCLSYSAHVQKLYYTNFMRMYHYFLNLVYTNNYGFITSHY